MAWFQDHARDLPWRSDPHPYKVWLSEIMCQQTQIATVLPYFERFIQRYPSIAALAEANEDELMRMWEGLGYYRRARSLHAASKLIVEQHDGQFPLSFDETLALPGIGRYTAGAILSISSNLRHPILEGNTQRVFSRWMGLRVPPTDKEAQKKLWDLAEKILPRGRTNPSDTQEENSTENRSVGPAAVNQAAMELGALICTPREPKCLVCPVAKHCEAHRLGLEHIIPGKVTKIKYEARDEFAIVVREKKKTRYLVRRLPEGVRFAGMWDFPKAGPPEVNDVKSMKRWVEDSIDATCEIGDEIGKIQHAVTKYRITLHVHEAHCDWPSKSRPKPRRNGETWAYKTASELQDLPMSTTGRKTLKLISKT